MRPSTRRKFLKRIGLGVAGAAVAVARASSGAAGANERVNLGVIGLSRGRAHCEAFATAEDARVVYVCDTDRQRLESIKGRYNVEKGVT
ncbi:MAG: twin-arginine translocation signal domain-containing protein, partial [Planctomycetota bacterium]